MNNTYNELDDFLDVEKVPGWKADSVAETIFAAVFLIGFVIIMGLVLWLV